MSKTYKHVASSQIKNDRSSCPHWADEKKLTVARKHQLKIARQTQNMPDPVLAMFGGMTKEQAEKIIDQAEGKM